MIHSGLENSENIPMLNRNTKNMALPPKKAEIKNGFSLFLEFARTFLSFQCTAMGVLCHQVSTLGAKNRGTLMCVGALPCHNEMS